MLVLRGSKSVCGPFTRNCQGVQQFLSSITSMPAGFCSQELWGLIFLVLEPWAEGPGVGLGTFAPEISILIFTCYFSVWDLHPSCQSQYGFFNSVIVEIPFSSIYDISEWWLFYSLVVILTWLCKEASLVYLGRHLEQKSTLDFKVKGLLHPDFYLRPLGSCGGRNPGLSLHQYQKIISTLHFSHYISDT